MDPIHLVGHSGCRLRVEEHDGMLIVTKIAKDEAYGDRLKKQHLKQKTFSSKIFRAPKVLESKYNEEGLFEFQMEYVNGMTLAERLKDAQVSSIREVAEKFLSLIPAEHRPDPDAPHIFAHKISELQGKLGRHGDSVRKALEMLTAFDWQYCMTGDCHGDLTLENILWKDGHLYFIDFLDSFYDSWMMDISKLLFDLECLWSYRHERSIDENLKVRTLILKKIIQEHVSGLENGKELLITIYHISLLHLIRILPYTDDADIVRKLEEGIGTILDIIKTI